jgi:hypothetical protein
MGIILNLKDGSNTIVMTAGANEYWEPDLE